MDTKDKNFSSFIDGLKSSNIASNISSLNVFSEQIEMLLSEIDNKAVNNSLLRENLTRSRDVIKKTNNNDLDTDELINWYIKFGDIYKTMLPDLMESENSKYLKEIAIHYLNIAKQTKDTRIKNIAVSIADELSK